jgi:pyrimidine operon attenuation protein/uracil phosphoribosyltransferase
VGKNIPTTMDEFIEVFLEEDDAMDQVMVKRAP